MFHNELKIIFEDAVASVHPKTLLPAYIHKKEAAVYIDQIEINSNGRIYAFAVGKAAPAMAAAAEAILKDKLAYGICITKYGHSLPLNHFKTIESGHPVPDKNSVLAGEKVNQLLAGLQQVDTLLILVSGGASSLLTDLPEGIDLPQITVTNQLLVNSGASIHEINTVRKHLSQLKGGQLLKAAGNAKVFTLVISDVPSDDPATIGSGLTMPDESSYKDSLHILKKYNLLNKTPAPIIEYLQEGVNGLHKETLKTEEVRFYHHHFQIIGNNQKALAAAKLSAARIGYKPIEHTIPQEGDTQQLAISIVDCLLNYNGDEPACLIWGGETTLTVSGEGVGGRNQHLALCLLNILKNRWNRKKRFAILCIGTDGTDGPTEAAGAWIHSDMLGDDKYAAPFIQKHIAAFDSYHFFKAAGGLWITGPTQTNVMDIIIAIIE